MLQLKRFDHIEADKFNEFREKHAPRNTDKSGGIIINESGLYVFYEEGEPYTVEEQRAWVLEQIRGKKGEILASEPLLRVKRAENEGLAAKISELEEEKKSIKKGEPGSADRKNELKQTIENMQNVLNQNAEFIKITGKNLENSRNLIISLRSLLSDLDDGTFVV